MTRTNHKRPRRHFRGLNPHLSKKAKKFYVRYGKAIRVVREQAGIALGAISGLSASRLRRIELGQCRFVSQDISALAKAHGLTPNEYLRFVAQSLAYFPRSVANLSRGKPAAILTCRIEAKLAALLMRQAKRLQLAMSTLGSVYLKEKILEEEFLGIGFRDAVGGREAYLPGHRVAVWEVMDVYRQAKTVPKTAEHFGWPSALVRCALKYAKAFAAEVAQERKAETTDRKLHLPPSTTATAQLPPKKRRTGF